MDQQHDIKKLSTVAKTLIEAGHTDMGLQLIGPKAPCIKLNERPNVNGIHSSRYSWGVDGQGWWEGRVTHIDGVCVKWIERQQRKRFPIIPFTKGLAR